MKYAYEPTSSAGIEGALFLMPFCYQLVQAHRAEPGDMIVDSIAACEVQGRPADDLEAVGMLAILIVGGVETTANATCAAVKVPSDRPGLQQELREHPERIVRSLDEFLRFDPPPMRRVEPRPDDVEGVARAAAGPARSHRRRRRHRVRPGRLPGNAELPGPVPGESARLM
jgi:cytochrome P450